MKKTYRTSQLFHITGPYIWGGDMYKYGLPYNGAAGGIYPNQPDLIDLMLAAVERHPELHVVTTFRDCTYVNRYEESVNRRGKSAVLSYNLHLGNADPEIEFTEPSSDDDYPETEELNFFLDLSAPDLEGQNLSAVEKAAINWIRHGVKPT